MSSGFTFRANIAHVWRTYTARKYSLHTQVGGACLPGVFGSVSRAQCALHIHSGRDAKASCPEADEHKVRRESQPNSMIDSGANIRY